MSSEEATRQSPGALALPFWARSVVIVILLLVVCAAGYHIVHEWLGGEVSAPSPERMSPDDVIAGMTQVSDDTRVIGVTTGGRYRAYVLQTFMPPDAHVYNDLIGKVPITVTFCDLDDRVRVFTAPNRERPLDVAVEGPDPHHARKLVLRVGDKRYCQDTGLPPVGEGATPFPYADTQFVRTTWGEWRTAHPDTDIYVGKLPFKPKNSQLKLAFPPEEGH